MATSRWRFTTSIAIATFQSRRRRFARGVWFGPVGILAAARNSLIEIIPGVIDSVVMDSGQDFDKTLGYNVKLAKRDVGFVQLPIVTNSSDNHVNHVPEFGWRRSLNRTRGGLNGIGYHDNRSFFSLGLGARVSKLLL